MSFSFSQSLLGEITSSQGSLSDSSQPLTQPMQGYPVNPCLPWLPPPRASVTSHGSSGQHRAMYTRVGETNHSKAAMADFLRDVQVRINSLSSSTSRMLEEGLVFLEEEVLKENSKTLTNLRSIEEILNALTDLPQVQKEETEKNSKHCLETAELLRMVLRAVKEEEDETAKEMDNLEEVIDIQTKQSQRLLEKMIRTVDAASNLEVSVKNVQEKLSMLNLGAKEQQSPVRKVKNTGGKESCSRREEANPPPTVARTAVRNFSFTREVKSQVQPICDFSTIMELDDDDLDSDTGSEWEE